MKNRRTTRRARTAIRGHVLAHDRRVRANIRNLSDGGALILIDMPLMEGVELELDFNLRLDPSSEKAKSFHAKGTAVWCNEDMDVGYQCGIRFKTLEPEFQKLLDTFLDSVS